MKRYLSLALALILTLAFCTTAGAAGFTVSDRGYPVLDDGESATIKIVTKYDSTYDNPDPNATWFWAWLTQETGITFEWEAIEQQAYNERINLVFTGDELPDLFLSCGFSTAQIMRYGASEGQLFDWADQIQNIPHLVEFLDYYKAQGTDVTSIITSPDGAVYSLPTFTESDRVGGLARLFINTDWQKEAGYETAPETLDDFTDMLRKFKQQYPDSTPLGGGVSGPDPRYYLLNAVGFLTTDSNGMSPVVLDGEVVIPAGHALYKNYLEIMKTYYDEGLVSQDFFTAENMTFRAEMAAGKVGVFAQPAYLDLPAEEDFAKFWAVKPLTSDTNPTAAWRDSNIWPIGQLLATDRVSDKMDLVNALVDFFYTPLYAIYGWSGPAADSGETLGMISGWTYNPEKLALDYPEEELKDFTSGYLYVRYKIATQGIGYVGSMAGGLINGQYQWRDECAQHLLLGLEMERPPYDLTQGDPHYRASVVENLMPYVGVKEQYPFYVWLTDDESIELSDFSSVLLPHVKTESAKFITGQRSLDEFDAYLGELEGMGLSDYAAFYQNAYTPAN